MEVTTLGYGAMELRGSPRGRAVSPEQADKILNAALDAGINYIDTSIDYGTSEEFIGMSSTLPNLKDHVEMGVFDAFQIPYSAVQREHEEIISAAAKAGAGIVIRGGVAKGGPGKEEGPYWEAWQKARVDDLLGDMSRMEFIFRFTISHPDLDTTIVGTINPEHLQDNINAMLKGPLPADLYEEAKRRLPREDLVPAAPPRAR